MSGHELARAVVVWENRHKTGEYVVAALSSDDVDGTPGQQLTPPYFTDSRDFALEVATGLAAKIGLPLVNHLDDPKKGRVAWPMPDAASLQ